MNKQLTLPFGTIIDDLKQKRCPFRLYGISLNNMKKSGKNGICIIASTKSDACKYYCQFRGKRISPNEFICNYNGELD